MVKWESKKLGDLLLLFNGIALAILLNQLTSFYFFRLDLTEEKRYTIKTPTKELLRKLDDDVYVEVYLEGDLNAGFRRLRKAVQETLEEFRIYSDNKVHYVFKDPAAAMGQQAQQEFMTSLAAKGIQPIDVIDSKDGKRTQKRVFPGALISYGGAETGVMLLKGKTALRSEEVLNQSIEGLEYELVNAINTLFNTDRKRIGFVTGHGELDSLQIASLNNSLLQSYDVFKTNLTRKQSLTQYDVLIVAKPTKAFSETDKYKLDQFLLGGGKLLLLIDQLEASMDSASSKNYFAFPYHLGLDDLLFHYGVRINQDVVQDIVSLRFPVITGNVNGKPQVTPIEWPFFPMINHYSNHPITRNLDATVLKIASSIDTVKATGIGKTPLLVSSQYSRKAQAPVKINVDDLRKEMKPENFSGGPFVLGYLLEGEFSSLYANRFLPEGVDSSGYKSKGVPSKLIVVADGDLARNEVSMRTGQPQMLGLDGFSGYTFANLELIMNMVAYLADEGGMINARNKQVKIRPLDKEMIKNDRLFWQLMNLVLPLTLVILFGLLKIYLRKRKFGNFGLGR